MHKARSSHKRKRSSARADKSRKEGPTRWIVNVVPEAQRNGESSKDQRSTPSSRAASKAPSRPHPRLSRLIEQHPFNQSLELILPWTSPTLDADLEHEDTTLPPSMQTLLDNLENTAKSHSSYRARIPLSLFLDPIFVTAHIRTGTLVALSNKSSKPGLEYSEDDVVCLDGQGTLVLSLCKDTYQTLGLTGRASHFSRLASGRAADRTSGSDTRFVVELPLLSPSFVPGKKGYQQALTRLRAWDKFRSHNLASVHTIAQTHLSGRIAAASASSSSSSATVTATASTSEQVTSEHATWDMLFVWSPDPDNLDAMDDPNTFNSAIHFPDNLVDPTTVQCLGMHRDGPTLIDSVWIPKLETTLYDVWSESNGRPQNSETSDQNQGIDWQTYQENVQEAVEWSGLVSLLPTAAAIRTYSKPDTTCVYSPPGSSRPGKLIKLSWSAAAAKSESSLLLSPLFVSRIAAEVDSYLQNMSEKEQSNDASWIALSCSGFPHAPLTWRSKTPFSQRFGSQPETNPKTQPKQSKSSASHVNPTEQLIDMSDVSSEEDQDEVQIESDSSSLDLGSRPKGGNKRKPKRSKRQIRKNQTEHMFTPHSGETGWVSFCFAPSASPTPETTRQGENDVITSVQSAAKAHWILVELVGTDTRS